MEEIPLPLVKPSSSSSISFAPASNVKLLGSCGGVDSGTWHQENGSHKIVVSRVVSFWLFAYSVIHHSSDVTT